MKIWISCDMEGVAGIVDWDQCRPGSDGYGLGCALLAEMKVARALLSDQCTSTGTFAPAREPQRRSRTARTGHDGPGKRRRS